MPDKTKQKLAPNIKWIWLLIFALLLIITAVILTCVFYKPGEIHSSLPEELTSYMTYEILNTFPHDPQAFTQGLVFHEGYLYESTGLYGESSLRKVDLESGEILERVDLPDQIFAEGMVIFEDHIFQLTWREKIGFVYDLEDFLLINQFFYPVEGWGLTHDGQDLIFSDGTSSLYFMNRYTFEILGSITVTDQGQEIQRLNELEYIQGEIFANIWGTDDIIRIDPETGQVLGWIDMSGILPDELRTADTDVLNGIVYNLEEDRLFITGKCWPRLYEIQLIPISSE